MNPIKKEPLSEALFEFLAENLRLEANNDPGMYGSQDKQFIQLYLGGVCISEVSFPCPQQ